MQPLSGLTNLTCSMSEVICDTNIISSPISRPDTRNVGWLSFHLSVAQPGSVPTDVVDQLDIRLELHATNLCRLVRMTTPLLNVNDRRTDQTCRWFTISPSARPGFRPINPVSALPLYHPFWVALLRSRLRGFLPTLPIGIRHPICCNWVPELWECGRGTHHGFHFSAEGSCRS